MSNVTRSLRRCPLLRPQAPLNAESLCALGLRQGFIGEHSCARTSIAFQSAQRVSVRAAQTVQVPETATTAGRNVPTPAHAEAAASPGKIDDTRFEQDWSVQYWRDWKVPSDIRDEDLPATSRAQNIIRHLQQWAQQAGVFETAQSVAYWSYHIGRLGFFATQGLAGVAFSNFVNGRGQSAKPATAGGSRADFFNIATLLRSGIYIPVGESLAMFNQDYENIRRGLYKMPWDATTPAHKQSNPLNMLDKGIRFLREASVSLKRRSSGQPGTVWLESGLYPEYYLNTWHYQTDGWLSEESAKVYETSTETVFTGRQDAMQRQGLIPLRDLMMQKQSADGSGLQLVEIGCGTGRFATFVKDNYPKLGVTQLDLSPFYLQEARRNLEYWRKRRGGADAEATSAHLDRFLQAPAEKIPAKDETFDVAVSIYLFHEIPEDSRRASIAEMWRVLKPGGMAILTDGNQLGDRPMYDKGQGNFQKFNEPNWGTHIATDYSALFGEAGFVPHKKILASGSKVLSFVKPANLEHLPAGLDSV